MRAREKVQSIQHQLSCWGVKGRHFVELCPAVMTSGGAREDEMYCLYGLPRYLCRDQCVHNNNLNTAGTPRELISKGVYLDVVYCLGRAGSTGLRMRHVCGE